jgi:hypothetical protein
MWKRGKGYTTRLWMALVLCSVGLGGCVDAYNTMAKIYGCDPAAIDRGYCTMPKEAGKR